MALEIWDLVSIQVTRPGWLAMAASGMAFIIIQDGINLYNRSMISQLKSQLGTSGIGTCESSLDKS